MNDHPPHSASSPDPAPLRPYVRAVIWALPAAIAAAFSGLLLMPRATQLLEQAYAGQPPVGLRVVSRLASLALSTWVVLGVAALIGVAEVFIPARQKHVWRPRALGTLAWMLNCVVLVGLVSAWVQVLAAFAPVLKRDGAQRALLQQSRKLDEEAQAR